MDEKKLDEWHTMEQTPEDKAKLEAFIREGRIKPRPRPIAEPGLEGLRAALQENDALREKYLDK